MNQSAANLCPRCNKPRIVAKTWKETSGTSVLIYTQMICPDKACQKMVNSGLLKEKERRDAQKAEALIREKTRQEHIAENRLKLKNQ